MGGVLGVDEAGRNGLRDARNLRGAKCVEDARQDDGGEWGEDASGNDGGDDIGGIVKAVGVVEEEAQADDEDRDLHQSINLWEWGIAIKGNSGYDERLFGKGDVWFVTYY